MENNNPFARKVTSKAKSKVVTEPTGVFDLGEKTDIPDTYEEDMKKIENLIPQPGDKSVEEGYQKMLNILQKNAPKMPLSVPDTSQESIFNKVEFTKPPVEKEEKVIEMPVQEDPVPAAEPLEKGAQEEEKKELTKSEELGLHYTDEEILPLLDSLLTHGYASESINMRGNTITFRTSFLWEDRKVLTHVDELLPEFNLKASGSFLYDLYSLASNIEQIGANYFKPITKGSPAELEESFMERVDFLEGLPSPFVTILSKKRLDFIKKVQFLIDNYDRLLKAF